MRSDCVYQNLVSRRFANNEEYYTFKDLFYVQEEKISVSELIGEFKYCQIGDVEKDGTLCPVILDFGVRDLENGTFYCNLRLFDV